MAISFISSSSWSSNALDSHYTITKPASVVTGDTLVAFVASYLTSGQAQITHYPAASGWVLISDIYVDGAQPHQMSVFVRTVQAGDPASWSGQISINSDLRVTACHAYRGASGITPTNFRDVQQATSMTTGSVSVSSAYSWLVAAGSYEANNTSWSLEMPNDPVTDRVTKATSGTLFGDPIAIEVSTWDTSKASGTGSFTYTVSRGATWEACASWIGVLNASDTTTSGSMSIQLSRPTVAIDALFGAQGDMTATLPFPTMDGWSGIASPPEGTLDVLVLPDVAFDGYEAVLGTMGLTVSPVMEAVAETRRFGSRVVVVEAENRTVVVRFISDSG